MKNYKSKNCFVAFIDILGAKELMCGNPKDALNIVHNAYDDAINMILRIYSTGNRYVKTKIFSDNIVISVQYTKDNEKYRLFILLILCAYFQERLLAYNILMRGGISRGDFFIDNTMVWGEALVKAYQIESQIAIYPRIVIEPKLIGELEVLYGNEDINDQIKKWVYQDNDGLVYVDYFHDFTYLNKNANLNLLTYISYNADKIIKYQDNYKVAQKLLWHSSYLKRKLNELSDISTK